MSYHESGKNSIVAEGEFRMGEPQIHGNGIQPQNRQDRNDQIQLTTKKAAIKEQRERERESRHNQLTMDQFTTYQSGGF